MRARTTTVLGLILLLAAVPVHAASSVSPPGAAFRVFVGTTSLRSSAHRCLAARSNFPFCAASGSQAFLATVMPLFGSEGERAFGAGELVAIYVPAASLGKLRPVAIGSGDWLAWSPYGAPPGWELLDLMMARQPLQALVPGEDGLQRADLRIAAGASFGEGRLLVSSVNLRGRNAPGEDTRIEPPPLALAGLGKGPTGDGTLRGTLERLLKKLRDDGYLVLANPECEIYEVTGKIEYLQEVVDFLMAHQSIPDELAEEADGEGRQETLF